MRKLLKWIGSGLAGLLGLLVVAAIVAFALTSSKLNRSYDIAVAAVSVPNDEATLARGEHLVRAISGCDGALQLTVRDDGVGLAQGVTPGVGLGSMRERAEELGAPLRFARAWQAARRSRFACRLH